MANHLATEKKILAIHALAEGASIRSVERITGEFQRRFSLPDSADAQNIKAKFVNGVLEVAIPKLAQVQPRRIAVEAA